MLVPIFNLVTHRPDLIIDHLAGYLTQLQSEFPGNAALIVVPAVALAAAIIAAIVAMKSGIDQPSVSFADHIQRDIQAFRQVIRAKEDGQ